MRTLIFQQGNGGHFDVYLGHAVPALAEVSDETVVVSSVLHADSDRFGAIINRAADFGKVDARPILPRVNDRPVHKRRFAALQDLRRAIRETRPDYVLLPTADPPGLTHGVLARFGLERPAPGIKIDAIYHSGRAANANAPRERLKQAGYSFALGGTHWQSLSFVSAHFLDLHRRRGAKWAREAIMLPDPITQPNPLSKADARRMLGVPEEGRYIGYLGSLNKRSDIPSLLRAFTAANPPDDVRLLLAGRVNAPAMEYLNQHHQRELESRRIIVMNRFLTDDEINDGAQALDVCCIPRVGFVNFSSSAMHAVAAKRPILAHATGWLGFMTPRFDLGWCVDLSDPEVYAAAIKESLEQGPDFTPSERGAALLNFHRPQNFVAHITHTPRRMLDPNAEDQRDLWDWDFMIPD